VDNLNIYLGEQTNNPQSMLSQFVGGVVESVIDDLRESYRLAMQEEGLDKEIIERVLDTVDAVTNNYDL